MKSVLASVLPIHMQIWFKGESHFGRSCQKRSRLWLSTAEISGLFEIVSYFILFHLCHDQLDDISSVPTPAEYWQVLFNPTILLEILLKAFIVPFLWACLFAFVYTVKSIHLKNTSIQISLQWTWRHAQTYDKLPLKNGLIFAPLEHMKWFLSAKFFQISSDAWEKKQNNITWVQREKEAYYMYETTPQQAELSNRGQLMLRYINFMNPRPPR